MKTTITNLVICFILLLASCGNVYEDPAPNDIPVQLSPEAELSKKFMASYGSGITGEITVPVRKGIQLSSANSSRINWGNIERKDENIRYLAIGGSLAAGVRDGGLYREGQLTSYPNLIANQLGIRNFKQPLFSEEEGNGSGYKVLVKSKPILEYNVVKNNLAFKAGEPYGFEQKVAEYDNMAVAYSGGLSMSYNKPDITPNGYGHEPYLYRIQKEEVPYFNSITQRKSVDFFTHESPTGGFLQTALNGGFGSRFDINAYVNLSGVSVGDNIYIRLMNSFKLNGAKWGLILNIPEVLDFPYFKLYTLSDIKRITGAKKIQVKSYSEINFHDVVDSDVFIPNEHLLGILKKGKTDNILFENKDVLRADEYLSPKDYNSWHVKEKISSESGFPVVDIYSLYKKIVAGSYITHDGVQVDPTFPTGNFFSSDGIHPTAFGQAIIANECIKVLNETYKANIPLIETANFLK